MKFLIALSLCLLSFQSLASGLSYHMVIPLSGSGSSGSGTPEAPWESPVGEGALHTNGVTVTCLGMSSLEEFYLAETNKTYHVVYSKADAYTYEDLACTSNITDMSEFFIYQEFFNPNISSWDTSSVTDMNSMFFEAESFNQDISNWETFKVTDMGLMFHRAISFDQDIGFWNTSKVTNMRRMFSTAETFNQDISIWDTSKVTDMFSMFSNAHLFNQAIGAWDTSIVIDMTSMFRNAELFNQDLSNWCVSNFPSKPTDFDSNAIAWTDSAKKPVWGTCPAAP